MLQIGASKYSLVGLDTNIVSEILSDREGARQGLLSFFEKGYIPCFSVYSLFELRCRREIYDNFVNLFDVFPCILLKNEEQLFEEEKAAYPNPTGVNPVLLGISYFNTKRGTNLRNLLKINFENPVVLRREKDWPDLKKEILSELISLKKNFPPKGRHYLPNDDGIRFVQEATIQQIIFRAPKWVKELSDSSHTLIDTAFPSIRMTLWTIFFRLYVAHQRVPETQDVFDALISTPAPYLDAVITENFQADIYKKVKKLDNILSHSEIYTLKDLRVLK